MVNFSQSWHNIWRDSTFLNKGRIKPRKGDFSLNQHAGIFKVWPKLNCFWVSYVTHWPLIFCWFCLAFSSPGSRAQVSFSNQNLSIVRLRCVVGVVFNFSHLHLLQNHRANFNKTLHNGCLGEGIQVCSNEGARPFERGDNYEKANIHWRNLNIFSRTTGPISTKFGTKHPLIEWIQVCSN